MIARRENLKKFFEDKYFQYGTYFAMFSSASKNELLKPSNPKISIKAFATMTNEEYRHIRLGHIQTHCENCKESTWHEDFNPTLFQYRVRSWGGYDQKLRCLTCGTIMTFKRNRG